MQERLLFRLFRHLANINITLRIRNFNMMFVQCIVDNFVYPTIKHNLISYLYPISKNQVYTVIAKVADKQLYISRFTNDLMILIYLIYQTINCFQKNFSYFINTYTISHSNRNFGKVKTMIAGK